MGGDYYFIPLAPLGLKLFRTQCANGPKRVRDGIRYHVILTLFSAPLLSRPTRGQLGRSLSKHHSDNGPSLLTPTPANH